MKAGFALRSKKLRLFRRGWRSEPGVSIGGIGSWEEVFSQTVTVTVTVTGRGCDVRLKLIFLVSAASESKSRKGSKCRRDHTC